ncbi:Transporter cation channel family protein [Trichostrongylus colubriformis]|uniref:Transporter cation channel family protein n=1 Tax=Trichostrongylus colubriformis TaxID=6319 RepID=A0AAN8FTZ5_TRICO
MPAMIFMMEYKTKEELMLQPHTFAEHLEESSESDSSLSDDTSFSDSSSNESEEEMHNEKVTRQRAGSEKEPVSLSFQQLMRDKLRFSFRKDHGTPNGNGIIVTPQVQRSRARTMSVTARKRKSKKDGDSDDSSDKNRAKSRRRSSKKHSSLYVSRPHSDDDEQDAPPKHRFDAFARTRETDRTGQRSISWRRKLREFLSAPITTFWLWSLSFYIFLIALSYTILIKTPRYPSWVEWYLLSYVVVWLLELLRKLVMIVMIDRKQQMWRKVLLYFGNYRNGVLLFATVTYVIAFCIRCNPSTRMAGRVLLVCNSVLWSLKLVDYMRVFRQLGPYITMAAEMIPRMLPILAMLFVSLLSFGLVREAITYPYENWHWLLLRNIFYKPYFMLYGEVYAPEIDVCGDEIWDAHIDEGVPIGSELLNITGEGCVPGYFVAPLFMTVFMLIANVLLMNTMVACCTYVFEHNVENTQEIWLFERYAQVMEYDSTPFIPPPLTIFYHLYWLFRWVRVRNFSRKNLLDASLKLFLSEEQIERIHSFEEECIEDMEREKDIRKQSSNDERIHRTAERSDQILNRVNVVENIVRADVRNLDMVVKTMESRHKDEMDALKLMNARLELLLRAQMKCATSVESVPDSAGITQPKESARLEKYEKKRRRTPPDLNVSFFGIPSETSPNRRRSVPRVTIADEPTVMPPTIVLDLVDQEQKEDVAGKNGGFSNGPVQRSRQFSEEGSESDTGMMASETYPIPLRKETLPHAQHHDEYTSIADTIRIDRNLYNDAPQFHYEPEPMCTEEESDFTAQTKKKDSVESV